MPDTYKVADALLPAFNDAGLLPEGDFVMTAKQLRASHVGGTPRDLSMPWDGPWRAQLVENALTLCDQLFRVGIEAVYLDGSFVTDKPHPGDVDGYFVCEEQRVLDGSLERELNLLDPFKCWTWDPRARTFGDQSKAQLPMWHRYRVEVFPHFGQGTGIVDARGHELEFPSAFRQSRDGQPRGIIKLILSKESAS